MIIVLVWLICLAYTKVYDIQFVRGLTQLDLMVGQYEDFKIPIPFTSYVDIDIVASPQNKQICYLQDADLQTQQQQFIPIELSRQLSDVITSYQYLLQQRYLIDMIIFNQNVFTLYSDGVYFIAYKSQLLSNSYINLIPSKFKAGKFIILNNTLFLASQNSLYRIESTTKYTQLKGYTKVNNFISACVINNTSLYVIDQSYGILLYNIEENMAVLQHILNKDFFKQKISLSGIVKYTNSILLLDIKMGLLNLSKNEKGEQKYEILMNVTGCDKMEIEGEILYIGCGELNQFNLTSRERKIFHHPRFRIKNIVMIDHRPMITGMNLIKVYNQRSQISTDLGFSINKVIVDNDVLILGSKAGLRVLKWNVSQAIITCGINRNTSGSIPSSAYIVIDVTAQCPVLSQLKNFNVSIQQFAPGDLCLYHYPIQITFWQGKQLNFSPLKIVAIVLSVCLFLFIIGWIVFRRKVYNLQRYLTNYDVLVQHNTTIGQSSVTKAYQKFQDQSQNNYSSKQTQNKNDIQQLHDIGD